MFTGFADFTQQMYNAYQYQGRGQRIGQFAYNYLTRFFILPWGIPDSVDCFYNDLLLGEFLTWVATNWEQLEKQCVPQV